MKKLSGDFDRGLECVERGLPCDLTFRRTLLIPCVPRGRLYMLGLPRWVTPEKKLLRCESDLADTEVEGGDAHSTVGVQEVA